MDSNLNLTTVTSPSAFGMPACAHALASRPFPGSIEIVRGRKAAVVPATGAAGFTQGYTPGTHAWRPPSC